MASKTVHFVYFSPCGGTARAAMAIGRDIALPKREHDITHPAGRSERLAFGPDDLVFFAFPVYGGRMPRNLGAVFAGLAGQDTPAALVAVYGNRHYDGAFLDLQAVAAANGFRPIAAIAAVAEHSIAGAAEYSKGRPDGDDREKLARFGIDVLEKANKNPALVAAPGEHRKLPMPTDTYLFPVVDATACTSCGRCVEVCPVGAIPASDPRNVDIRQCIFCAACVKYCPEKARILGDAKTRERMATHRQGMITRKEPELFV